MLLVSMLDFTDTPVTQLLVSLGWTQCARILAEDRGKHYLRKWYLEVGSQCQYRFLFSQETQAAVTICILLPFWTAVCRGSTSCSALFSSLFKRLLHGALLLCPVKEASQKTMQGSTLMESMIFLWLMLLENKLSSSLFLRGTLCLSFSLLSKRTHTCTLK